MEDFSVLTGGKAGFGIDKATLILGHLLNRCGYRIYHLSRLSLPDPGRPYLFHHPCRPDEDRRPSGQDRSPPGPEPGNRRSAPDAPE